MASPPKGQGIDITSLTIPQLSQIKKQFEDELTHLSNSFTQLRAAQVKFRECLRSIDLGVSGKVEASLYVPGTLADTENVIVDVGTGFYVEKSTKDATGFYETKVEELAGNLKALEKILQEKNDGLRMIEDGQCHCSQRVTAESYQLWYYSIYVVMPSRKTANGQKAIIYQEGDMNAELKIPQNWRIFSKFRAHGDLMLYGVWWWGDGS
ncbi:Prefoldin subunit 5 [Lachnellula arida]|uniref:Prefoldin subunit 5 n=1 Tax=Lachnellula arida TaxID=1316785 RepID=A0A8T9BDN2_9HELO|nr:Prefoldin subunit 5 [Lachnellula arida]